MVEMGWWENAPREVRRWNHKSDGWWQGGKERRESKVTDFWLRRDLTQASSVIKLMSELDCQLPWGSFSMGELCPWRWGPRVLLLKHHAVHPSLSRIREEWHPLQGVPCLGERSFESDRCGTGYCVFKLALVSGSTQLIHGLIDTPPSPTACR